MELTPLLKRLAALDLHKLEESAAKIHGELQEKKKSNMAIYEPSLAMVLRTPEWNLQRHDAVKPYFQIYEAAPLMKLLLANVKYGLSDVSEMIDWSDPDLAQSEIKITDTMQTAGQEAFHTSLRDDDDEAEGIRCIYRAMRAKEPTSDSVASDCGERRAFKSLELLDKDLQIAFLRETLAGKDARIAELKSELATRPTAFVDPEPEPANHNPFRDFPSDPRMIGR